MLETTHTHETTEREKKTARRGLVIYFAVLVIGSAVLESKILQTGESIEKVPGLILALMYVPLVASLVARFVLKEGFADISIRWGGPDGSRAAFLGWVYPIAVGFVAYSIAWVHGPRRISTSLVAALAFKFGLRSAELDGVVFGWRYSGHGGGLLVDIR